MLSAEERAVRLVQEQRFFELVRAGSSYTAACEAVGVDRRQGYRWRQARGEPSLSWRPGPVSARYLSLDERFRIADLHRAGQGVRAIATVLGRSPSTISRELRRHGQVAADRGAAESNRSASDRSASDRSGSGVLYGPYRPHHRAEQRRRRPKPFKLSDPVLATIVAQKLALRWSPEQIAAHLVNDG